MNKYVIIVAGGSGLRFGAQLPKQFLLLKGKPILMQTIQAFYNYDTSIQIIITLPPHYREYWNQLCEQYNFTINHKVTNGGQTRFHSVKNGLDIITEVGIVAIHDAVRPLVSAETLERCYNTAFQTGNAIPVVKPVDSIREIASDCSFQVDRERYRLVQTPQVFNVDLIKKAFTQEYMPEFTDDASVLEKTGIKINLVDGNYENIKITTQSDLIVASSLFQETN
jgi:2-C-methyl-D-erythritol 4-phosphate cytidylyltransferase